MNQQTTQHNRLKEVQSFSKKNNLLTLNPLPKNKSMPKSIFLLVLFCLMPMVSYGAKAVPYQFFGDSKSACRLVLPKKSAPEEIAAAELIKDIFARMGGIKNLDGVLEIHIGETPAGIEASKQAGLGKYDLDSFLIDPVDTKRLVIIGNRPIATFYGVCEFLERYAGVLWIWPGENGTEIPAVSTFSASITKQLSEPVFKNRQVSGVLPDWGRYNKLIQGTRDRRETRSFFHHNVNSVLKRELFDTHPEYFNMLRGQRFRPVKGQTQACTTNQDVIQIFTDAATQQFKRFPWIDSFSVSANDGGNFCECENCRSLDIPGVASQTDRYFTFANAVASKIKDDFPDKFITCLAYGLNTIEPPVKLQLLPNVMPYLVIPSMKDHHQKGVIDWSRHANQMGVYFWLHGKAVPKFYPHKFGEYLRFLGKHKVTGVYMEVYPDSVRNNASSVLEAPRLWIIGKQLWNPEVDVNSLMDTFCRGFYGPAAKPMRTYYRQCEEAWNRTTDPFDFNREYESNEYDIYSFNDIKIMTSALQEAKTLAKEHPIITKRLEMLWEVFRPFAAACQLNTFASETTPISDTTKLLRILNDRVKIAASFMPDMPLSNIPNMTMEEIDQLLAKQQQSPQFWQKALKDYPLLVPFLTPLATKPKNIVRNSSFLMKNEKISNWSVWFRPNTEGTVEVDKQKNYEGKAAVRFEKCIAASIGQNFTAVPGSRYRISCQVWLDGGRASLSIQPKTAGGKWLGKVDRVLIPANPEEGGWQKLEVAMTIPENAARLTVGLGGYDQFGDSKAWFADPKIEVLYISPKTEKGE